MSENEKQRHRMVKARIAVSNREAFLASLTHRLILKEDSIPTTATDGVYMFYNPAFVESITDDEVCGCAEHETFHPAFGHIEFMREAIDENDATLRNEACDYAINQLQKFKLPAGSLFDPRFNGMSHLRIYQILKSERHNPKPRNGGKACGGMKQPKDSSSGKDLSQSERQEIAQSWEIATIQAANMARAVGKLSPELARLVDEMKRPAVNWRDVLNRFMRDRVKTDYSLIPPNRRYVYQGLYLHSITDELRMGRIVDVFDTSESIYAYAELVKDFVGEQRAIIQDLRPELATLIECDDVIHRVTDYTVDSFPESIELLGGGGTDFRPPFEYLDREGITPECLLYFTDLYGTFPAIVPDYPVLWIVYGANDALPPFGEVVHIR